MSQFNEWLLQVQAKENSVIGQDILDAVMCELQKQRVTPEQITHKKIREVLKHLKFRKAYEHVSQIHAKITGITPMRLSPEAEELCRLMFIAMQPGAHTCLASRATQYDLLTVCARSVREKLSQGSQKFSLLLLLPLQVRTPSHTTWEKGG